MKKSFSKILLASCMLLSVAMLPLGQTNTASAAEASVESRLAYVNGVGKVSVDPDAAVISLGVETEAKTSAEAQAQNKVQSAKLIKALKQLGVAEDNIKTEWYNIYPDYQYKDDGSRELAGYIANHSLSIKITDLEKVSDVLDQATQSGATNIGSVQYTVENKDAAYDEARKEAAEDAKVKAKKLADVFGFTVGKVISVSESTNDYYYSAYDLGKGGVMAEGNEIYPGEIDVYVNLSVTFEIL